ncbi:hypothetical protein [Rhodopseudomonas palustris]|uniref:hypothetical protein n=1 Tax=Rhodopseudomonas palustris TaxID=1076 RepID=UPI0002FCDD83
MSDLQHDSAPRNPRRDSVSQGRDDVVLADAAGDSISDDECLRRLEAAVERQDAERLDEVASLIGRLAVPLEC